MSKISLTNLVNLQNETTAVGAINSNNAALTAALDNTLSRDGSSPNTMGAPLDMNSNRIINIPAPISGLDPVRLQDVVAITGGPVTFSSLPVGGFAGQVLAKNSLTNYDVIWSSPSSGTAPVDIRSYAVSPLTYATVGTGLDDTATLQAAVNAVKAASGGTILIPQPLFLTVSSTINLVNGYNIRITGGNAGNTTNFGFPAIIYTGATGSLFKCDGITAFELDHLRLIYSSASYTGNFIDLNTSVSGVQETQSINIHDNYIAGGSSSAKNATSLIALKDTLRAVISRNFFQYAVQCIAGGPNANNIQISNNWFDQVCTSHIGTQGEGWLILNNVFEPTNTPASNSVVCNGTTIGLDISANTFNDSGTGTLINLVGGSVWGLTISGNDLQGGTFAINAGTADGVIITGNQIATNNISSIIVSAARNVTVLSNSYQGTPNVSLVGVFPSSGSTLIDDNTGTGIYIGKTKNYLRLASDLSVTSSTLPVNSSFTVDVVAGNNYTIELYLSTTQAAAGGLKIVFAAANGLIASSLITDTVVFDNNTVKGPSNLSAFGTLFNGVTSGTSCVVKTNGTFTVGTSGTLVIQFAQSVSNATASILKKGSWIQVKEIA